MNKITIAIDGYSSCGKSTLAKQLAKKLGYSYIDSGAMYRAVALWALENKAIENAVPDTEKIISNLDSIKIEFRFHPEIQASQTYLNGRNIEKEIRGMAVSEIVSKISSIKEVRQKMVALQRKFGEDKGVVMDGRDIGSVVFPNAELKLFMTADPAIRAQRRYDELKAKGTQVSMEEIAENLRLRDYEDTTRKENPLIKATDAVVLDNTHLTPEQQFSTAYKLAEEKLVAN
ncbi:MAG: Cytidylate kinase [Bacteroidia bacterium]|nr:Cytidylate kinase [Bacteroidia bacterium]